MLKLKELRFSGIGRFVEEQVINFESLGSMVQVDGQNNNTKGSSGAGKSTIFQALEFLFGINKIPSTVLKSRQSESGISVQGTFDYDGKVLVITRAKKLKIVLDGVPTEGSSAITEAKLDEIISIDRDLFRPMLHKRQKEGGFFLNMAPKAINDFLMSCLSLGHFKSKIEKLDKEAKALFDKSTSLSTSLETSKSALKATEDATMSLGVAPVKPIEQADILALKQTLDVSTSVWASMVKRHKIETDTLELSRPQVASSGFDRAALDALESRYDELSRSCEQLKSQERDRQNKAKLECLQAKNEVTRLHNVIALGDSAKKKAEETAEQIKQIRIGKCYTCAQDWKDEKREKVLIESLKGLKDQIVAAGKATLELPAVQKKAEELAFDINPKEIEALPALVAELQNVGLSRVAEREKEKQHQNTEDVKNREKQSIFAKAQAALTNTQRIEADQARGTLALDQRRFETAVATLKAYDDARVRHETSLANLSRSCASYKAKVDEQTASLAKVKGELAIAEELKRGVKNYLSCSFDDALETISENSTRLIRNIPNMANATIQLDGQKETGEGKIKEEVNAVIHMDGEENVDIRSLCGGERTATDLAIDLSVIDLIETTANKGIDLFVLDEPFDGLDTVCIEMALEVLKNSNTKKRLIVVDHNPEVKQMVESKLLVVRDGASSRIVQS